MTNESLSNYNVTREIRVSLISAIPLKVVNKVFDGMVKAKRKADHIQTRGNYSLPNSLLPCFRTRARIIDFTMFDGGFLINYKDGTHCVRA